MQFSSALVALVAAFAMVEPIQAGGVVKAGLGIVQGIFGRDVGEHMNLLTRESPLAKSLGACMGQAKEKMKITAAGGNNFRIDAADGSMPQPCIVIAESYMKTKMADGKLSKAGNGFILAVLPKDVKDFQTMVQATAGKGAGSAAKPAAPKPAVQKPAGPKAPAPKPAGH